MFRLPKVSRKTAFKIAGASLAAAGVYASQNFVRPNEFGLRDTLGIVSSGVLPPGLHVNLPFVQYTHSYQNNIQRIELNAGSCRFITYCGSTSDQNPLTSDIVLNYKVQPDLEKLAYHRWSMDGSWQRTDGYWLITGMMNDSANAVLGKHTLAQTISSPSQYLEAFQEDLSFRLKQNNVPVAISSIELRGFHTLFPSRSVAYAVKKLDANTP